MAVIVGLLLVPAPGGAQRLDRDRTLSTPSGWDPYLGMDEASGRIPRVGLPTDLEEPARWRYIPEGRIKPGNAFQRLLVSSFMTPQIFYQQDVGLGGGFALTDIDFRNERRREFLGAFLSYTTEGQQSYRLAWRRWLHHRDLPEGGVLLEERSFIGFSGGYQKTLTRRFFGLGDQTPPSAESSYTDEATDGGARGDFAWPHPGSDWIVTLGIRGEHHNLGPGRVSGVPTTNNAFPTLFAAADGTSALLLTTGLRYDTRDSQHQAYRGWVGGIVADIAAWQNNEAPAAVVSAYGRVVLPLPPLFHDGGDDREENPPTDTLAFGLQVDTTLGTLPYFYLPSLGGSYKLRGYIANRFIDDSAWHGVAEYRFWVIPRGFKLWRGIRVERVGLALFGEAGAVAGSLGDLPGSRVHLSYGVGLRFELERLAVFRADFGFSGEGLNFSLEYGLSF